MANTDDKGIAPVGKKAEDDFSGLVEALCSLKNGSTAGLKKRWQEQALPSRQVIYELVESLRSVLFPGYFGFSELKVESLRFHVGSTLDHIRRDLQEQIKRGLCFSCEEGPECLPFCDERAREMTGEFLRRLPKVQRLLALDVRASYDGDPAAATPDEVIFCYPGLAAITNYRLAHELHMLGVPIIPRMITEAAHSATGIDIHPGAVIGENFFIDHGTGVVIGETCIIGSRVRLYQGVTLGAKSFQLDEKGNPVRGVERHPIVEDDVTIYSGATILGRVTIGRGSVIGGNVWLVHSVPPGSRITQAQTREEDFERGAGI
ncbi:MAG: serine acetyltransferase [Syntrophobacterales bacterium RBG_19FT_COMBO_59_10]|nr:MAG: serine acetyltransferase [Syntrophobacterales bacterium RBG_19FT_COMBO_59_10]